MATPDKSAFLSGIIEGFYGQPWSPAERLELFDRMVAWGLNTYFYCPKDDWKNRAIWREPYSAAELEALASMVRACATRGIHFVYGLSPGLDIRYSHDDDRQRLIARFEQMLGIGCAHFALLFDDIPDRMEAAELAWFGSLASAQCQVANVVHRWVHERQPAARFLFCPTPYCGRMAERQLGGEGYLETLGRELAPAIDILWTGPEIISREITLDHIQALTRRLRRPPLIWDNLHANDYDGHRFFCGPYSGRPLALKSAVRGILTNPNCELALNFVAFRTLAAFVHAQDSWDPRAAYLAALDEWLPQFATAGAPLSREDVVLLGDCYYLPFEDGAGANSLYVGLRRLLSQPPAQWGPEAAEVHRQVVRLRDVCARLADLRARPLFYAIWRRTWELREEMDLLDRYLTLQRRGPEANQACASDFHLPDTYRGGLVARLQRLLVQQPNGTFLPAPPSPDPLLS
ncbi:MAG: beta-N-acetylglucosaminidase domain-containing protein [Verrucomicrobiales bacterium]|nr:beta-N-acetylglucosaminidase domain-containing protein [Verrucomicrobiales bacterium]